MESACESQVSGYETLFNGKVVNWLMIFAGLSELLHNSGFISQVKVYISPLVSTYQISK